MTFERSDDLAARKFDHKDAIVNGTSGLNGGEILLADGNCGWRGFQNDVQNARTQGHPDRRELKDCKDGDEIKIIDQQYKERNFGYPNDKAIIDQQFKEATAAMEKFHTDHGSLHPYISRDDITDALKRTDLTDADRRGLQFLSELKTWLKLEG